MVLLVLVLLALVLLVLVLLVVKVVLVVLVLVLLLLLLCLREWRGAPEGVWLRGSSKQHGGQGGARVSLCGLGAVCMRRAVCAQCVP